MLVDVPKELELHILRVLGMTLIRSNHAAAACERMPTMRPLVVVLGGKPSEDEVSRVEELAIAISAQVVVLSRIKEGDNLDLHLMAARRAANLTRRP
jgi:hypothetical protein